MKALIQEAIDRIWEQHVDTVVISKSRTNTHIVFPNNITLSIGWGKMHTCSHDGNTAEIAIWNSHDLEFMFDNTQTTQGWLSAAEVEMWAGKIAAGQLTFR